MRSCETDSELLAWSKWSLTWNPVAWHQGTIVDEVDGGLIGAKNLCWLTADFGTVNGDPLDGVLAKGRGLDRFERSRDVGLRDGR